MVDLPPKNHNNPPEDATIDLAALEDSLTLRNVHMMRAAEGHIAIVNQMPDHFTDENEATYTTDLIKLMQNCTKEIERRREKEKKPYWDAGVSVDTFFNGYKKLLAEAIEKATKPLDDWLKRKADAEKEDRERDAKLLIEQAQSAARDAVNAAPEDRQEAIDRVVEVSQQVRVATSIAAAPITSMASSKGIASKANLKMEWVGTITDVEQLELVKLRPYISHKELQAALDRFVKQGGRQCAGAEIKEIVKTKVK